MVDTYDGNNTGFPIIVNTDTSNGPGVHWIVALRLPNGEPYVYDPLGPQNNRIGSQMIPADVFLNRDFGEKPHFYPYRSQLKSNSLCGWHAIYVANLITEGIQNGLESPQEIDRLIESKFGRTADGGDVRLLETVFDEI